MKLSENQRGIVVSSPTEIDNEQVHIATSSLDPQELRSALLFWDHVVWPIAPMMRLGSNDDEQFLEEVGVLSRPEYRPPIKHPSAMVSMGEAVSEALVYAHAQAFAELDNEQPGRWCLAQGANSLLLSGQQIVNSSNAQVEIHRAIPVPDKEVPLAEIISFRERRSPELLELRHQLDVFVEAIKSADDKDAELAKHTAAVDKACADAIRVGSEWQFPIRLTSFKTTYEVRPFQTAAGALTGYITGAASFGLPVTSNLVTTLAGAAVATAPALKLSFDGFEWQGLKPRIGPYRYVYQFHREVF